MADENDPVIDELKAEPIESPNNIADFLKSIEDQDLVSAEKKFNDMVGDRLQDTLDQAKARIAASIYGDAEVQAAKDEVENEMLADEDGEEIEDEDLVELPDDDKEDSNET